VRKADNLPPSCAVTKSGHLNFLEHSGPLQACNETAFTLECQQKTGTGWLPLYWLEFRVHISIPNKKFQTLYNISMLEKGKVIFKCAWVCMWPHPGGRSTWPQARSLQGGILGCVGLGTAQAFSRCGMPHVCFWPGIFVHLFTHLLLSFLHTNMSCCAVIHIFVCPYCISFSSGAVTPFTVIVSFSHATGSIFIITISILH